jgi:hypothetical protein
MLLWGAKPRARASKAPICRRNRVYAPQRSSFPKPFRRLTEFLTEPQSGLAGFLAWLANTDERVLDLAQNNFTHFDTLVQVSGGKVRLTRRPEQIVFISAKTASPVAAPWLAV